jgi:thiamine pyrophosphate-dependent acetolactate synthase large subunit-like protein
MNSGPFGTMGVGLPFGLGAKVAAPDKQVVVLHGDGSFGLNAMELDTAARHGLNVICVISLNGGWSADPAHEKPGRELGYTRFEDMARALNCYGERVESPDQIRPALDRAAASGKPAVVNVVTDYAARASTQAFAVYMT